MEHPREMEEMEVSEILEVSEDIRTQQVNECPVEIAEEVMVEEVPPKSDLQETLAEIDESMHIPKFKTELVTAADKANCSFMKRQVKGETIAQAFCVTLAQKNLDAEAKQKMVDGLKLQNETMKSQLALERRDRYRIDEENKKFLAHLHDLEERKAALSRHVENHQNITMALKLSDQQLMEKSKRLDQQYHQDKENCRRLHGETRQKFESNEEFRKEEIRRKKEILANLRREHEAIERRNATLDEALKDKTVNIEAMKANCTVVSGENEKVKQEGQTLRETLSNAKICYDALIQQFSDQQKAADEKLANLEVMKLKMDGLQEILNQAKTVNEELSQNVDAARMSYGTTSTQQADSLLEIEKKTNDLTKKLSDNIIMENAAAQQLEHLKQVCTNLEAEGSNYQKESDELSREAVKDEVALGLLRSRRSSEGSQLAKTRNQLDELLQARTRLTQLLTAKNEYRLCHKKVTAVLPRLETDWQQHKKKADEKLDAAKKSNALKVTSRTEALEMDKRSAANLKRTVQETREKYREKCAKSDSIHAAYLEVLQQIEELKNRQSASVPIRPPSRRGVPSGVKTDQRKGILKSPRADKTPPKKVSFFPEATNENDSEDSSIDAFFESVFKMDQIAQSRPARTAEELFDDLQANSPPERGSKD